MTDHKQVEKQSLFWIKIWMIIGAIAYLGLLAMLVLGG